MTAGAHKLIRGMGWRKAFSCFCHTPSQAKTFLKVMLLKQINRLLFQNRTGFIQCGFPQKSLIILKFHSCHEIIDGCKPFLHCHISFLSSNLQSYLNTSSGRREIKSQNSVSGKFSQTVCRRSYTISPAALGDFFSKC